jgi:Asp-tRNA(Asn)/Glu-tRNA(Gln) amidotransferase A subunit family amidase
MNKTKQLMAAITASMFVAGPVAGSVTATANFQQQTKQPDENKQTDPTLQQNSDDVLKSLKDLSAKKADSAKTVDEVAKQLPKLTRAQVEDALDNLRQDDYVRRSGTGSKDDPYRYYVPAQSSE